MTRTFHVPSLCSLVPPVFLNLIHKRLWAGLTLLLLSWACNAQALPWRKLPGSANDIAVAVDGTAWAVGTESMTHGFGLLKFDGSQWVKMPGAAVRLDVNAQGEPITVNDEGSIQSWNGSGWQTWPGKAKDIGVGGPNSVVWMIAADNPDDRLSLANLSNKGRNAVHRWNGKSWDNMNVSGSRIDVDGAGNAWVVGLDGYVQHWDGKRFVGAGIQGVDVAAGPEGVFVIGTNFHLYALKGKQWVSASTALFSHVSVDGKGNPWAISMAGQIWGGKPLAVGDRAEGGYVFHVSDGGWHGLVAHSEDVNTKWGNISWAAATQAAAATRAFGYSDWLLPDTAQFELMRVHAQKIGGFGARGDRYWTSSKLTYGPMKSWEGQVFHVSVNDGNSMWGDTRRDDAARPLFQGRAIRKF